MAVKTAQYASQISQDTSRGPSMGVWADCPIEDFKQNMGGGIGTIGYFFEEEFTTFPNFLKTNAETPAGQWSAWLGNNAAVLIGNGADTTNLPLEGGVCGFTAGANNNLSITMTGGVPAFRFISPASGNPLGGKMWFEASVAVGSLASGAFDFFVGLMDPGDLGTRITSAADLAFSAANTIKTASGNGGCLGFWKRATTNITDFGVVYNINNGTAQLPGSSSDLQKLSLNSGYGKALSVLASTNFIAGANQFIKLGFLFDPAVVINKKAPAAITSNQTSGNLYKPMLQFFVNGQAMSAFLIPSDIQSATFPVTWMCPTIAFRSGGTGIAAGIAYCDWIRVAQLGTF